jgi:hypothetical protein
MRFRFMLAVIAGAVCHFNPAVAQTWYWCDPAGAYYPYVATCPVPWRAVNPNSASRRPYVAAPPSAATAAPFANPQVSAQQTPPHALPDQYRALCGEASGAEEWRRTLTREPSGACFEKWHANLEPCQDSVSMIGWALDEERKGVVQIPKKSPTDSEMMSLGNPT